jgi:hypothetical protein
MASNDATEANDKYDYSQGEYMLHAVCLSNSPGIQEVNE